ncbi:MAG TPA: helix-turn-helix transcriptional regulator [Candidatus Scubalenecus merdavium]|uniref:Helix-turn-helix transcriptional regulator n=1 Tax=Candidatus Scybalenecus merdavium TaxID=2840939 RepID=A0A9D1MUE7_9FIRM|nr:helix-turn-helix transcriptional regulator [Candidatus Scubalenecus merdavium]
MDPETTGRFIKEMRVKAGMTQKELADKLNCTDKAVSRWETGKGFPDVSYLIDLAAALDVNVNELLLGRKIESENEKQINDALLVDTIAGTGKKIYRQKIIVLLLLGLLLLAGYYLPVATMTPSDMMGVLFFHVLSAWGTSFLAGFIELKWKWLFPAYCSLAYCPMAFCLPGFGSDLLLYLAMFLGSGYILMLLATGLTQAAKAVIKRIKKK